MLCKDSTYKWILSRGKTVSSNSEGGATRCIGTHKDISDSKNKELLLAHERYLLNALMDYSPESIYFKDLDSKFIRINNFTAKVLGFDNASEVIGKSDFDFFSKEYATKTFNDEQQIIKTGHSIIEEEKGNEFSITVKFRGEKVFRNSANYGKFEPSEAIGMVRNKVLKRIVTHFCGK